MNATPDHPELDRLSADLAGLLGRIGLDPSGGRPTRRDRLDIRFAASAARHPGRVAVRDALAGATYLELEWLADDIARRLSGRAGPGSAVAVRAGRSCMTAGAVVGVLRAGAAVLPLEPGHSAGLQEFLMRDGGAEIVLSDCGLLRGEIPVVKTGGFVIAVRPPVAVRREVAPGTAFMALPAGGDPGRAVAVRAVSHADVLAWVDSCVPMLGAGLDDVWTHLHPLGLDLGMREMWGPLLSGGRAVVVDGDTARDARALVRLLAREGVTVVTQLPSGFARLNAAARGSGLPALRHVLLSDGPVDGAVLAAWRAAGIAPQALTWDVTGSPTVL
ncbi:AMP-binding protein [Streptomyces sp. NPDC097617]|uniref:AMP-binding protein n=1 Tax=Streptomyces sp. NPDC097617 TaxID=3366091 RepID=UPI0038285124